MTAAAAAAAAAARARARAEEEESMTGYSPQDLADGWEFKILRSATNRFKNPAFLRRCLDEEAAAGWTLVEKFDNGRIRLKRPAAARARDTGLAVDPYRTYAGLTDSQLGLRIALTILLAIGVVFALIFILTHR